MSEESKLKQKATRELNKALRASNHPIGKDKPAAPSIVAAATPTTAPAPTAIPATAATFPTTTAADPPTISSPLATAIVTATSPTAPLNTAPSTPTDIIAPIPALVLPTAQTTALPEPPTEADITETTPPNPSIPILPPHTPQNGFSLPTITPTAKLVLEDEEDDEDDEGDEGDEDDESMLNAPLVLSSGPAPTALLASREQPRSRSSSSTSPSLLPLSPLAHIPALYKSVSGTPLEYKYVDGKLRVTNFREQDSSSDSEAEKKVVFDPRKPTTAKTRQTMTMGQCNLRRNEIELVIRSLDAKREALPNDDHWEKKEAKIQTQIDKLDREWDALMDILDTNESISDSVLDGDEGDEGDEFEDEAECPEEALPPPETHEIKLSTYYEEFLTKLSFKSIAVDAEALALFPVVTKQLEDEKRFAAAPNIDASSAREGNSSEVTSSTNTTASAEAAAQPTLTDDAKQVLPTKKRIQPVYLPLDDTTKSG